MLPEADFTEPAGFMAEEREDSRVASMGSRHHTRSLGRIPEHSAALTTEEWQEASPLAASRASAEVSMVVVSTEAEAFTEAEAVAGSSDQLPQTRLMIR